MGGLVFIPEPVRAMVQSVTRTYDVPHTTNDLRQFVDRLDLRTTPAQEQLVDVILVWVATAEPDDPRLPLWGSYARDACRRLHPADHYRARRAALAHSAVQAGILTAGPHGDRHRHAEAVIQCIACTVEPSADGAEHTTHLTAYLMLHAHGHCDQAIAEVTRLLRTWNDTVYRQVVPATVVVLVAMLTACGRTDDAARVLQPLAGIVGIPGSRFRDLIALCSIGITDIITPAHRAVCVSGRPEPDRHRWSATLHGEHPDQHLCVPPARPTRQPAPGPTDTVARYDLDLSEIPERLKYQLDRTSDSMLPSSPHRPHAAQACPADLWLICQDCHLALLLGRTSVLRAAPGTPISPVTLDDVPAWQHPTLGRALWRLLHEHLGHPLQAVTDRSAAWFTLTDTQMTFVGLPGSYAGTPHASYTDGWPQQPTLTDYRGRTPQPVVAEHQAETYLICVTCGLELILGVCTINPEHPHTPTIADTDTPTAIKAVLRMVTEHPEHDLLLLADNADWEEYFDDQDWADTIRPSPDTPWAFGDVTREQYLAGWPEHAQLSRYRGFNPVDTPPPIRPIVAIRACCARPSPFTEPDIAPQPNASPSAFTPPRAT